MKRVMDNFDTLLSAYLDSFKKQEHREESTGTFAEKFTKFNQYSRLKTLANLHYADSFLHNSASIVSSIEFDKDDEFFATAGVIKKIKIFEFANIVHDFRDEHQEDSDESNLQSMGGLDGVARYPIQGT